MYLTEILHFLKNDPSKKIIEVLNYEILGNYTNSKTFTKKKCTTNYSCNYQVLYYSFIFLKLIMKREIKLEDLGKQVRKKDPSDKCHLCF